MSLHECQQDGVGLVNRQHSVDAVGECLHGPTSGRGPHAIEFARVAPDALEFLLELTSDGVATAAGRAAGRGPQDVSQGSVMVTTVGSIKENGGSVDCADADLPDNNGLDL